MTIGSSTAATPSAKKKFPSKPRAGLTCEECRRRKVRCDLVINGKCCTNCRLDDRDCKPNLQRGRGKAAIAQGTSHFPTGANGRTVTLDLDFGIPDEQTDAVEEHSTPEEVLFKGAIVISSSLYSSEDDSEDGEDHDCVHESLTLSSRKAHSSDRISQNLLSREPHSISRSSHSQFDTAINKWRTNVATSPLATTLSKAQNIGILHPLSSCSNAWDRKSLESGGPPAMFSNELRNAMLCAYVNFVYPSLPIVDLEATLRSITLSDRTNTIHLALLQAVLLLGAQYVPIQIWQGAGYGNRDFTMMQLHKSIDILYKSIQDPVTRLQVALHLTYSWENRRNSDEALAWLVTALKLARYLGLPYRTQLRNPAECGAIEIALHKRIWYSCVTRDSMMAIEYGRQPLLRNIDLGICTVVLSDFELQRCDKPTWPTLRGSWIFEDFDSWKVLADQFIGLIKLCTCIPAIFSLKDAISGHASPTAALLGDLTPQSVSDRIWQCTIDDLLAPLDTDECFEPSADEHCAVTVQKAILDGLYCSLLCNIYTTPMKDFHFKPGPRRRTDQPVSINEAQASAKIISTLAEKLLSDDLIQYLPAISVQIFLAAVTTLLDTSDLSKVAVREQVCERLRPCMQSLAELGKIYPSAHVALSHASELSKLIAPLSTTISVASN